MNNSTTLTPEAEEALRRKLQEQAIKIEPIEMPEKAVYFIGKENDGVIQILDKTSSTDKKVVTTEAQKLARENSHDYVVLKLISKHKKVVTTKDINYD